MKKLKIAIIGHGRSGWGIHGKFFKTDANTFCDVVAVVELDEVRRNPALEDYPGCQVYADYRELYDRKDLDLVVNATISTMHYSITKDLLEHGLNVVVEKPMARNYYECCDLIETAKQHGVLLAVFQQSFLAPYYQFAKEVAASGKLGEIIQVSIHFSGFSRRWDWQTLQCCLGGGVYNTGPHPIGFALDALDFAPEARVAYSKLDHAITSGDSDDYAKIILTAPGKPVVDVEISNIDAFNDYNIKYQGTKGTLQCNLRSYKMKYICDGENPPQPVQKESLRDSEGLPIYCSEKLITHEESGDFGGSPFNVAVCNFYKMVHARLTEGVPMSVTPEMAAQIIRVIETVHAENPLTLKYQ